MGKPIEFRQALGKLKDQKVIMVVGNEPFYRDQIKNRVISLNKDYELVKVDASEMDESAILSAVNSRDLFSTKRIFCISNFTKIKKLDFFTSREFSDILILDSSKKGKSKAYKELEKNCLCIECIKPKPWDEEDDAVSKIKGYLTNAGYSVSPEDAQYLYTNIGYNLYKLMREMQKLTIYKENDTSKIISKSDIDAICVLGQNYNIFDMVDNIILKKKKEALELLDKIFKFENSPAILLITLWYTHFENLLYVKTTTKDLSNNDYIKLPRTVVTKKLVPQANKITTDKILESLNFLAEADYGLRKGSFDLRLHIEKFILNF
jgi:DNA polymerase III delta subunit